LCGANGVGPLLDHVLAPALLGAPLLLIPVRGEFVNRDECTVVSMRKEANKLAIRKEILMTIPPLAPAVDSQLSGIFHGLVVRHDQRVPLTQMLLLLLSLRRCVPGIASDA
jgi:hypothetical protein